VVLCGLGDDFLVWFRLSSLLSSLCKLSFAWGSSSCRTGWILLLLLLLLFSVAGVIVSSTCLSLISGSWVPLSFVQLFLSEVFVLCRVSLYANVIVGDVLRRVSSVSFVNFVLFGGRLACS